MRTLLNGTVRYEHHSSHFFLSFFFTPHEKGGRKTAKKHPKNKRESDQPALHGGLLMSNHCVKSWLWILLASDCRVREKSGIFGKRHRNLQRYGDRHRGTLLVSVAGVSKLCSSEPTSEELDDASNRLARR